MKNVIEIANMCSELYRIHLAWALLPHVFQITISWSDSTHNFAVRWKCQYSTFYFKYRLL